MVARRVDIEMGVGGTGRIVVDGCDLSAGVRPGGVQIHHGGRNEVPTVTLDLVVEVVDVGAEQAEVRLPHGTFEALKALGWSPPAGDL